MTKGSYKEEDSLWLVLEASASFLESLQIRSGWSAERINCFMRRRLREGRVNGFANKRGFGCYRGRAGTGEGKCLDRPVRERNSHGPRGRVIASCSADSGIGGNRITVSSLGGRGGAIQCNRDRACGQVEAKRTDEGTHGVGQIYRLTGLSPTCA